MMIGLDLLPITADHNPKVLSMTNKGPVLIERGRAYRPSFCCLSLLEPYVAFSLLTRPDDTPREILDYFSQAGLSSHLLGPLEAQMRDQNPHCSLDEKVGDVREARIIYHPCPHSPSISEMDAFLPRRKDTLIERGLPLPE